MKQSDKILLKTKIVSLGQRRKGIRKIVNKLGARNSKLFEENLYPEAIRENEILISSIVNAGASEARHYNIAYGLMRNIPYKNMERKCRVKPDSKYVLDIIHIYTPWNEKANWTLEKVKALLEIE